LTLWIESEQSQWVGWLANPYPFSRRLSATFATRKTIRIGEKPKQSETNLVLLLRPAKNRSQQTIDPFAQHIALPGAIQYMTEILPGWHQEIAPAEKRRFPDMGCFYPKNRVETAFFNKANLKFICGCAPGQFALDAV
jgi:hypothetical protein